MGRLIGHEQLARRVLAGAAAAMLALLTGGARAEEPRSSLALSWVGPVGCPSQQSVRRRVLARVGTFERQHALRADGRVHLLPAVAPKPPKLTLLLRLKDGESSWTERRLNGSDCESLADAAVLIVALAYDPDAKLAPAKPQSPDPNEPNAATPPPLARAAPLPRLGSGTNEGATARSPLPRQGRRFSDLKVSVRGAAVLDIGGLPLPAGGVEGMVGVNYDALRGWLVARFFWERQQELAERPGVGGRFKLWTLGGRGCGTAVGLGHVGGAPRFEVGLCGEFEIGEMSGTGFGVSAPTTGTSTWLGLYGGVDIGVGIAGPLRIRASALAGIAPLVAPFGLEGIGEVYRPSWLLGRLAIGPELVF